VRSKKIKRGRPHRAFGHQSQLWLAAFLYCFGLLSAGLFTGCSSARPDRAAGLSDSPGSKAICWVLFDLDSLFCSPCLAPLLEFCQSLPAPIQVEKVRGILVYAARPDRDQDGRHAQVIQKKIHGFVKANGLKFPIALDGLHVFNSLVQSAALALLFDDTHQSVRAYAFPLKPGEKDEIMQHLLN